MQNKKEGDIGMKKKRIVIITGLFITLLCFAGIIKNHQSVVAQLKLVSIVNVEKSMQESFLPAVIYAREGRGNNSLLQQQVKTVVPALWNMNPVQEKTAEWQEDPFTYEMILMEQANDENYVDQNGELVMESSHTMEDTIMDEDITIDRESLGSVEQLLDTYYIIDASASVDKSIFDIDEMLEKDMKVQGDGSEPQLLIYHSHSQEAFVDSVPGDPSTSIVGVGGYLANLLEEDYGINVMHHTGVYDLVDGKLDRSKAYELAEKEISKILDENPSITHVIDLHRDGINENTHLVTDINGKQTAQIMFFNGLSRSKTMGDIDYLYNPYIQDNLSLSLQLQLTAKELFPGFTRKIYLKSYRYNMNLRPAYLLIEAGAQTNTVEEMMNAMEALAKVLHQVIQ